MGLCGVCGKDGSGLVESGRGGRSDGREGGRDGGGRRVSGVEGGSRDRDEALRHAFEKCCILRSCLIHKPSAIGKKNI